MGKKSSFGNKSFVPARHIVAALVIFFWLDVNGMSLPEFMQQPEEVIEAQINEPVGLPGNTRLIEAALYGDVAIAQRLLTLKADVDKSNNGDRNALYMAIFRRSAPMVRVLIENQADVCRIYDGSTPLHGAVLRHDQDPEVVQLLCDAKAQVNAEDQSSNTPLTTVLYSHGCNCQEYDNESKQGEFRPGESEQDRCNAAAIVRVLLSAKADANKSGGGKLSPVAIAAHTGCVGAVEQLINAGALVCPDNEHGFNFLCGECEKYEGMVPLLQGAWDRQQIRALKQDNDGRILWVNIGVLAALTWVVGYAFSG